MWVDPTDVTRSSGDCPYKTVFFKLGLKVERGVHAVSVFYLFWPHQVWRLITIQDSESKRSTRLCLDCFHLWPRHQIIYNWKPGGPLFRLSILIWKNTVLYGQSPLDCVTSEGVHPHTIISSSIVCILSKISNYKWHTTINFIRDWTFNLFLPILLKTSKKLYEFLVSLTILIVTATTIWICNLTIFTSNKMFLYKWFSPSLSL